MQFLFERAADHLWWFRLWYLAELFLKISHLMENNEVSLSLHGKQLTDSFIAN